MAFKKPNGGSEAELELDHELPPAENDDQPGASAPDKSVADLQAELEKARTERAAFLDRAARLQAEFDNFRKRNAKETQDYREYALADALQSLLPILDSLDRALKTDAASLKDFHDGIELIDKQFHDALAKLGVQPIPAEGEAFDPTPANIEGRVIRRTLPDGLKLVMFPKKTRGGTVVAVMNVRFGDEKALFGKSTAGDMAGALLMRGTKNKTRQQVQDETDRLKAQINVNGGANAANASVRTMEANLADSLHFVRELMREPAFPEAEFEQVRQQRIAGMESAKSEPTALASLELSRHLYASYQRGDIHYIPTIEEQIEDLKKLTLDDVRKFYGQFYGVGEGEIAISGQFDPAQMEKLVGELFGDWKSPAHYQRIANPYEKVAAMNQKVETPDKQNSLFLAAMNTRENDEAADYPALLIAGMIFGGSPNSRMFQRIRVKDGLSYGANAGFSAPAKDDGGRFSASAIAAPQNVPNVESAFQEEVAKALKDGFTADEVEKAKKTLLDERKVGRTEEASIANLLLQRERWGRTMDWDAKLEAAVAAVTVEQVNAAFRQHVDPAQLSIVKGGDFKKAGVYQQ